MTKSEVSGMVGAGTRFFAGHVRMVALALATATIACVVIMLVGAPLVPVREADAVTYHTIKGTAYRTDATTTNNKVAGASVYLFRWNGSSWTDLGKKATTDSYGNFTIRTVATGYYYKVRGYKAYGDCFSTGYFAIYDGFSNYYYASPSLSVANARIPMSFQGYLSC